MLGRPSLDTKRISSPCVVASIYHNPRFAPVIHPTLQTGVEALIVAARAWLAP